MQLPLLTKYRTELMGVAMLLVIFSNLPVFFNSEYLRFFKWNCHFGVDFFFLLSGLGLVFSISKNSNWIQFYYKRIIRIFPIYIIVNTLCLLLPGYLKGVSVLSYLLTCTTIGYWFGVGYCDWFIPHLIIMYLLFPLYWAVVKHKPTLAILAVIILMCVIPSLGIKDEIFFRAAFRYADFLLGVIVGYYLINGDCSQIARGERISLILFIIGLLLFFVLVIRQSDLPKGWFYGVYVFLVIGSLELCAKLVDISNNYNLMKPILGGGRLCGNMSLELYLTHICLIGLASTHFNSYNLSGYVIIIILVSSFLIAYGLHILNQKIVGILEKNIK